MTAPSHSPGADPPRAIAARCPSDSRRIRVPPACASYPRLLLNTARLAHHLGVPPRQFGDPAPLAAPDRILVNQVPPDTQGHGAGTNEIHSVGLIHTAGSNQRDIRERRLE